MEFFLKHINQRCFTELFFLKVLQLHNICGRGDAGDILDTDLQVIQIQREIEEKA
jgi:hypothetical protein